MKEAAEDASMKEIEEELDQDRSKNDVTTSDDEPLATRLERRKGVVHAPKKHGRRFKTFKEREVFTASCLPERLANPVIIYKEKEARIQVQLQERKQTQGAQAANPDVPLTPSDEGSGSVTRRRSQRKRKELEAMTTEEVSTGEDSLTEKVSAHHTADVPQTKEAEVPQAF